MEALIAEARKEYHRSLLEKGILTIDAKGIPSNADSSSKLSVAIAQGIANRLTAEIKEKALGQTSGAKFEEVNMQFLADTFPHLQNLRPGDWHIIKLGNRSAVKTSSFAQYEHLEYLSHLTESDAKLAASMGNDYMVAPDVVVYRNPVSDEEINSSVAIVDDSVSKMTDIRKMDDAKRPCAKQPDRSSRTDSEQKRTSAAYCRGNRRAASEPSGFACAWDGRYRLYVSFRII